MENLDLKYLCSVIGNLAGIPIRLYQNEKLIFYHSIVDLPVDPISLYHKELFEITSTVGYFVTPTFYYYGLVNSKEYKIILGPSGQISNNEQDLKELAFRLDIQSEDTVAFVNGMKSLVCMPLESIMQILCALNYILNNEKLGLNDIIIFDSHQQVIKKILESERLNQNLKEYYNHAESPAATHNTLALEQTIMNIVRKGDTQALKEWVKQAPAVRAGIIAKDQLRQVKNTFIVTATLVSRAAIRGGMNIEDSLTLSDSYIQKCEILGGFNQITNLQYHMVLDFTERVERLRVNKKVSKLTLEVADYIQHHLSETITTEDIAQHLFISRTHLSKKFKDETGENLIDFILKEKTEETKRLLRYTDKSLNAISNYLGFSSQSHFTRVFKKYSGNTPNEYRQRYNN